MALSRRAACVRGLAADCMNCQVISLSSTKCPFGSKKEFPTTVLTSPEAVGYLGEVSSVRTNTPSAAFNCTIRSFHTRCIEKQDTIPKLQLALGLLRFSRLLACQR